MHELAITQSMLDIVLKQAEKAKAKKITKINLVIGDMTGVVSDSVQFYLEFMTKGTVAEGAQVFVQKIPSKGQCRTCKAEFEIQPFDLVCPNCQEIGLNIISGKELFVESIEVD